METPSMDFETFYRQLLECLNGHCLYVKKQTIGYRLGYSAENHIYDVLSGKKRILTKSFYILLIHLGFDPHQFIEMLKACAKLREEIERPARKPVQRKKRSRRKC